MYVDLLFVVILIGVIFFYKRNFSSIVYGFVIIDLVLRILTEIKRIIPLADLSSVINNYIPEGIPGMVANYLNGIAFDLFMWLYIIIYSIFLFYTIKIFVKKK